MTCRIEGAYFALPRWGKGIRTGRIACRVINTYSRETLESMSAQEINQLLTQDLWEDAYERQALTPVPYRGRNRAQGLEHALYLCPCCQSQNTLRGEETGCAAPTAGHKRLTARMASLRETFRTGPSCRGRHGNVNNWRGHCTLPQGSLSSGMNGNSCCWMRGAGCASRLRGR